MKRADILTKRETLNVLEKLFKTLDETEDDVKKTYGFTGKMIPKQKWNSDTNSYEDVVDDETGEVVMREEWDYIPKTKDEYTPEDLAQLDAIKNIKSALEKLI